jgi:hypothetical protein
MEVTSAGIQRALKKANLPRHGCTFAQTSQQLFADIAIAVYVRQARTGNMTDMLYRFDVDET